MSSSEGLPDRLKLWSNFLALSRVLLGLKMSEEDKTPIRGIPKGEKVKIVEMDQEPGELQVQPKIAVEDD